VGDFPRLSHSLHRLSSLPNTDMHGEFQSRQVLVPIIFYSPKHVNY
jgi:hypothetical protein